MEQKELQFDPLEIVCRTVGLKRSQVYALMARNAFPKGVKLGSRAVRWERSEVQAWMRDKLSAREGGGQ